MDYCSKIKQWIVSVSNFWFVFTLDKIHKNIHHLSRFYLPLADRPGTGDYKMPCVRASVRVSVRHVFTKAFLSLKIL